MKISDIIAGLIIFFLFNILLYGVLVYTFMTFSPSQFPEWIRGIQAVIGGLSFIVITSKVIEKWE